MHYRHEDYELTLSGVRFILLRKNASTAVSNAVYQAMGRGKRRVRYELPDLLNVAVWRDPVERAWSAWKHVNRGMHLRCDGFWKGMGWQEFVCALCGRSDKDLDIHLRSQASVIGGRTVWWMNYDMLEEDWAGLREWFPWVAGLQLPPLQRMNEGDGEPAPRCDALRERFAVDYEFQRRDDVEGVAGQRAFAGRRC